MAGAWGFTSGPKQRRQTSGSVSLVFSKVTPVRAPSSEQKYSSSVNSVNRMSLGLFKGWAVILPVPCTLVRQYGGRGEQASTGLETIGATEVEDAVIAPVPVFEAASDLGLGGAGLEAHEGVGKIVADVVMLRGEVVTLGLAFLADEFGLAR